MEGRAVVGDALRQGSIQVIELKAAMVVGPGSTAFEVIRDLVNHLLVMITPRLSSYWLYFVTSVPPTTAMSLVKGLAHDYIGEDREMRELVPQRLLTFRESVAVTLQAEKNHDTPARWVEGSIICRDWNPRYSFYAKKFCGEHETRASREALISNSLNMMLESASTPEIASSF